MSQLPQQQRRRLGSIGDSAPPSDSSESTTSETCEVNHDWRSMNVHKQNFKGYNQHDHQEQKNFSHHQLYLNGEPDCDTISIASTILSAEEREQVESFFSGLGTDIFVSSSLANLYESVDGKDDWRLIFTGIPVLLHDKGSARSRSIPRITFCLAERGSCFALWRDTIDNLSQYRMAGPSFHTMCLSTDHGQMIGFSFDSSESAKDLWRHIEKLISNPENNSMTNPGERKKIKQKKIKPLPLPPKSQISHPCQFHHVSSVTRDDADRYYSLQAFMTPLKYRQ